LLDCTIRKGDLGMMQSRAIIGLFVIVLTCAARITIADDNTSTEPSSAPADKSGYTLFNPTPTNLLRDLNPDRPSVTEGPYTVDAGHLQVESSFLEYTLDHEDAARTEEFSILPTNFRLGLLNQAELDVILEPLIYQSVHTGNLSQYADGFGDTTVRTKINFWGNDGGMTSFGLIPFVTFPTGSRSDGLGTGHLQGGLIFPLQINLPKDWSVGTMFEIDFDRNDSDSGAGVDWIYSAVVSHPIVGPLDAYVEYVSQSPQHLGHSYQAFFDVGVTYLVNADVQLDCGINNGLSKDTPDYTILAGISVRK
jgi:hypothetical protein